MRWGAADEADSHDPEGGLDAVGVKGSGTPGDPLVVAGRRFASRLLVGTGKVREPGTDARCDRGERGRDRHRRDPPHQHRSGARRAEPARLPAARSVHHPPEYRRLLRCGVRGAHLPAFPRAARRGQPREARGPGRRQDPPSQRHRDPGSGGAARRRRVRRDGLHQRRSGHRPAARSARVRERDAPRGPHRLRPRHLQSVEHPHHPGGGEGAHRGGRGGRNRFGRGGGDGARLRRSAHEHRDRGRPHPVLMASAMRHAVVAGREAFRAGRMPRRRFANASSPVEGAIA